MTLGLPHGRLALAPRPHWVTLDVLLHDDFPHR
jgi:hypothetical protein